MQVISLLCEKRDLKHPGKDKKKGHDKHAPVTFCIKILFQE